MTLLRAFRYNGAVSHPSLPLRAVLFDLDGTLIQTHIDFGLMRRDMAALTARYGVPPARLEGLDILSAVEAAREFLIASGDPGAASELRQQAFARLQEIEEAHCAEPVEIAGARELLLRLRERSIPLGIVTRNCRTVSERLVTRGGLLYDVLLTRDDVARTKPDPAHLLAALEAIGVQPEERGEAVMVGDHWMDVQAGRAAGMRTVGILLGRAREFFSPARPDLLVEQLADLLVLFCRNAGADPISASSPFG